MILKDLLYKVTINELIGNTNMVVNQIQFDSRAIQANDVFVALSGTNQDGHAFVPQAIKQGATVVVCQDKPTTLAQGITYVVTPSAAEALGMMASNYYGNPTEQLTLIGITGTNGKTTCTTLLYDLFQSLGKASVLVSTIKILINQQEIPTQHTTPDILTLNQIFRQAVDAGCQYAFMEVSSHGIHQRRIAGLDFDIAGFTNITHDHLDYHHTFAEYIKAKKRFFDGLKSTAHAITNIDDKNGMVMMQNTKASIKTYALKTLADFKTKIIESQLDGMLLSCNNKEFWTPMVGGFNAYNLTLVYGIAKLCGINQLETLTQLSKIGNVPGRFQTYKTPNQIVVVIDYAHTPDALENVLKTIQSIRTKQEKLFTLIGCGGNRDKEKRPKMAKIAAQTSDQVILTSDNPRSEPPQQILQDMQAGVPAMLEHKIISIQDRAEAIKTAFVMANPKDIILIAGKGHEDYQEINGVKHPFSDMQKAIEISNKLQK